MKPDRPSGQESRVAAGLPWTGDGVLLRWLEPRDLDRLVEYRNLEAVWSLQDWDVPYPRERAEQLLPIDRGILEIGAWTQLAIEHDGRLAGDVAILVPRSGEDAWIGYSLHPDSWGRGIAVRGVGVVVDRLFRFGALRIRAGVDSRNRASIRLLERLGFRRETDTMRTVIRGEVYDDDVYCLSRESPSGDPLGAVGTDGS